MVLRGSGAGLQQTRFLGRGFNLLRYHRQEEAGITRLSILDLGKISQNAPWSPWGEEIPSDIYAPELIDETIYMDAVIGTPQDVSRAYAEDSVVVAGSGSLHPVSIRFNYPRVKREDEQVHHIRHYSYKTDQRVSWSMLRDDYYRFFLSPAFVRQLQTLSGAELVERYGTHLVTGYDLGAFVDLIITTRQRAFSVEEGLALSSSAFQGKSIPGYASLAKKVEDNVASIRTVYMQGGSDYKVERLAPLTLFARSNPARIDLKAWQTGIRPADGTFLSLPTDQTSLLAIPSLITPMPLRVKYLSAILHKANPGADITYILSEPDSFSPVKYQGEYIYLSMREYDSGSSYIYYGDASVNRLSEHLLTGQGSTGASWETKIEQDGRWVLYSSRLKQYLCRDLKLRGAQQDPQGLRYWVLNPIVPTPGHSHKAWSKAMIKPRQ